MASLSLRRARARVGSLHRLHRSVAFLVGAALLVTSLPAQTAQGRASDPATDGDTVTPRSALVAGRPSVMSARHADVADRPAALVSPLSVSRVQSAYRAADAVSGTLTVTFTVTNDRLPAVAPSAPPSSTVASTSTAAISGSLAALDLSHDPNVVHDALLIDAITGGVAFAAASPAPDRQAAQLAWNLGDIQPLHSVTATLTLRVPANSADFSTLDTGATVWGALQGRAVSARALAAGFAPDAIDPTYLRSTVDANTTDPYMLDQAAQFGQDPLKEFAYVQSLGYDSYTGSLRGTRGTLWSGAGNALDKSSLLIAMLRASGIPSRYRHGTLGKAQAQQLILSMFPTSTQTVGYVPPGTATSDPANDPKLLAETEDHWWVEAYLPGQGWTDLDPTFPGLSSGQTAPGVVVATDGADQIAEVPDALRSKVTVGVKVESYSPLNFDDNGLSYSYPLTHTFDSAALTGEPVTLQHLVNSSSGGGGLFAAAGSETTYIPYLQVGGSADRATIEGQPFQDVQSFLAFASQRTTAEWLEYDVQNVDGTTQHYERTVKDAIGVAGRQAGTIVPGTTSTQAPFISSDLSLSTLFAPGRVSLGALRHVVVAAQQGQQRLADSLANYNLASPGTAVQSAALRHLNAMTSAALQDAEFLQAMQFYVRYDMLADVFGTRLLARLYADSPRIVIASDTFAGQGVVSTTLALSLDLLHNADRVEVMPGQDIAASFIANELSGVLNGVVESQVGASLGAIDSSGSVPQVFDAARAAGATFTLITPDTLDTLSALGLSHEAEARIAHVVAAGKIVVVPTGMVAVNGSPTVGWYEIDPQSGATVDTMENGQHDFIEYILLLQATPGSGVGGAILAGKDVGNYVKAGALVAFAADVIVEGKSAALQRVTSEVNNFTALIKYFYSYLVANSACSKEKGADFRKCLRRARIKFIRSYLEVIEDLFRSLRRLALGSVMATFITGRDPSLPSLLANPEPIQPARTDTTRAIIVAGSGGSAPAGATLTTNFAHVSGSAAQNWQASGQHAELFGSLNAPSAGVYDANGALLDTGASATTDGSTVALVQGAVTANVTGTGSLSYYPSALSSLAAGSAWDSYTAELTSSSPYTIGLSGVPVTSTNGVHTGNLTLSVPGETDLSGAGATAAPNFADTTALTGTAADLEFGPATVTVGSLPFDASNGFVLIGYTGPLSISHGTGGTDSVQLGVGANYVALHTSPASTTTDPQTPVTFQAVIDASADDTYTTTVAAPDGWSVALDATGLATVTPAPGAQPGDYTVLVTAQSAARPDVFVSATHTVTIMPRQGMALTVTPDPQITVPYGPADPNALPGDTNNGQLQLTGAAYTVDITNTSTSAHTFALSESGLPDGWTLLSGATGTTTTLTLPAGGVGQVGLYISPTVGMLPAPGTVEPFTVHTQAVDTPSLARDAAQSFTVPAIAFSQVTASPLVVDSAPGGMTAVDVAVRNVGNVAGTFPLTVTLPISDWTAVITSPLSLAPGQTVTQTLTVQTPDGTLGQDYPVQIQAPSNGYTQTAALDVHLTSPAAAAVHGAAQTAGQLFPANLGLTAGLAQLGQAIDTLDTACAGATTLAPPGGAACATDLRDRVVAAAQQVAAAATTQSPQFTAAAAIDGAARTLGGHTNVSDVEADLAALQNGVAALQTQLTEVAAHGARATFDPGRRVVLQNGTAAFDLRFANAGSVTTTYSVTPSVSDASVALTPTGALRETLAPGAAITVPVTVAASGLGSSSVQAEVTAAGAPDLAPLRVQAGLTALDALLRVTGVHADPSFVEYGSGVPVTVTATIADVANEPISGTARLRLLDAGGTAVYSATQPLRIGDALTPVDYALGAISTTDLLTGTYALAVDIVDASGRVIPQASGQTALGVGQAVQATSKVSPTLVAPGDALVTTTITTRLNPAVLGAQTANARRGLALKDHGRPRTLKGQGSRGTPAPVAPVGAHGRQSLLGAPGRVSIRPSTGRHAELGLHDLGRSDLVVPPVLSLYETHPVPNPLLTAPNNVCPPACAYYTTAGATSWSYNLNEPMTVSLAISDASGLPVTTVITRQLQGDNTVSWDGTASGVPVPDGVYTLTLAAADASGAPAAVQYNGVTATATVSETVVNSALSLSSPVSGSVVSAILPVTLTVSPLIRPRLSAGDCDALYLTSSGAPLQGTYVGCVSLSGGKLAGTIDTTGVPNGSHALEARFSLRDLNSGRDDSYVYQLGVLPVGNALLFFGGPNASPNPFTPNGDGANDTFNVSFTPNATVTATLAITNPSGQAVTAVTQSVTGGQAATISWDGTDARGNVVPDAPNYQAALTLVDGQGRMLTYTGFGPIGVAAHPFSLTSPPSGATLTGTTTFSLTVSPVVAGSNIYDYLPGGQFHRGPQLGVQPAGSAGTSGEIIAGVLTSADGAVYTLTVNPPTVLENGRYDLYADFSYGGGTQHEHYKLGTGAINHAPEVDTLAAAPNPVFATSAVAQFDAGSCANGSNDCGGTTLTYFDATALTVTVTIRDATGAVVATPLTPTGQAPGPHSTFWNGARADGSALPSGVYTATVGGPDAAGTVATSAITLGVVSQPTTLQPVSGTVVSAATPFTTTFDPLLAGRITVQHFYAIPQPSSQPCSNVQYPIDAARHDDRTWTGTFDPAALNLGAGMTYSLVAYGTVTNYDGSTTSPVCIPVGAYTIAVNTPPPTTAFTTTAAYTATVFAHGFLNTCGPNCGVGPIGLAFDASGNLYVADRDSDTLYKFGPDGGTASTATQVNKAPMGGPTGLTFSRDGQRLYATRYYNGDVVELNPSDGSVIRTVAGGQCNTLGGPLAIGVDPLSGDLLVTNGGFFDFCHFIARVSNYANGPGTVTTYATPGGSDGLTIAPDGTLYSETDGCATKIAGTNQPRPPAVTTLACVKTMDGIALATSNDPSKPPFLVTNNNDGTMTKVDLTAPYTQTVIFQGGTRGDFVTVGPDGCLYATQSSTILKLTNADGSCSFVPFNNLSYIATVDHSVPLTGVTVLTDTLTPAPISTTVDGTGTRLRWQQRLNASAPITADVFQASLPAMRPGEVRQVAAGTTITYTGGSAPGVLRLGPLYVSAARLVALAPPTQTVGLGGQAIYTVTLSNPTVSSLTLTPTVAGLPGGWAAGLAPVTLPPGAQISLPLIVTVPANGPGAAPLGDYPFAVLVGTGSGGQDQAGATLNVTDTVTLSLAPSLAAGFDGDAVTYTATITNTGATDRDYALSVAGLAPGTAALPPTVTVPAGQALDVPFTVTVPPGLGPHLFTVRASDGVARQGAGAVVDTLGDRRVAATLSPSSGHGGPGVPVLYHLTITNTADLSDTYALSVGVPDGWSYTLGANGAPVDALSLSPHVLNAATLDLMVTPGLGATSGDYPITATVRSRGDPMSQATPVATLTVGPYGVQVGITPKQTTLSPTDTGTWQVAVTNTGALADTYTLVPSGVVSGTAQFAPASLSLGPGQTGTATLTAGPIPGALSQTYRFGVTAVSQADPAISNSGSAAIGFTGYRGVRAALQPGSQALTDTLETSYLMVITNTGNLDAEYTFAPGVTPGGLDLTPEIDRLEIPAHMAAGVLLRVRAHQSGTYEVSVAISSTDGTASATASASLTVGQDTAPTSTPTPSATPVSTTMPTPTASASPSPTPTDTATSTPPSLPTASASALSPTPPATATSASANTATPIDTPTSASTATSTDTPTPAPTIAPSATPIPLAMPSATPTPAVVPSVTPTALPTATSATATLTSTPTNAIRGASTSIPPAEDTATGTATVRSPITVAHPSLRFDRRAVAVGARLCARGSGFLPGEPVAVAMDGVAVAQATTTRAGAFTACFVAPGSLVEGPNDVSAVGARGRTPALASVEGQLRGSVAYLVGASTARGEDTELDLLNPGRATAVVTLRFYRPAGDSFVRSLTVPGHTRATLQLSRYLPGVRGFGVLVRSERVVAAQMIVRRARQAPYTSLGSGLLARRWYLAEGYTNLTFHETLCLLNPNDATARVRIRLLPANGLHARTARAVVWARRTLCLDVNRLYPRVALAAVATSDRPLAVERVLTFGDGGYGATGDTGTPLAATAWLFAEGATTHGRQTFLTVLNPGARRAHVTAFVVDPRGRVIGGRTIAVDGLHRGTMRLNDTVHADAVAVTLTSDQPVVAERPFYLGNPNAGRVAATLVYGRNGAGRRWTFPAGDTRVGGREDLTVLNPNASPLRLRATSYLSDGRTVARVVTVAARARYTLHMEALLGGRGSLHGTVLEALDNWGFVAEQSIYDAAGTTAYGTAGLAQ